MIRAIGLGVSFAIGFSFVYQWVLDETFLRGYEQGQIDTRERHPHCPSVDETI